MIAERGGPGVVVLTAEASEDEKSIRNPEVNQTDDEFTRGSRPRSSATSTGIEALAIIKIALTAEPHGIARLRAVSVEVVRKFSKKMKGKAMQKANGEPRNVRLEQLLAHRQDFGGVG